MSGRVCKFFAEGRCKKGNSCNFVHPTGRTGRGDNPGWGGNRTVDYRQNTNSNKICKFFLEGKCRFGDNCKYSHSTGSPGFNNTGNFQSGNRFQLFSRDDSNQTLDNGGGWDNPRGNVFDRLGQTKPSQQGQTRWNGGRQNQWSGGAGRSNTYNAPKDEPTSPQEIASAIKGDMEEWAAGSMWPLSCYAYAKDTPCLPGLVDACLEEVRWEAYQAQSNSTSATYLRSLTEMLDKQLALRTQLASITTQDVELMLSNPNALLGRSQSSSSSTLFQASTHPTSPVRKTSLFGESDASKSALFRQSSLGPNIGSMFGGQGTQPSVTQNQPQSLFGNMTQSSDTRTATSTMQAPPTSPAQEASAATKDLRVIINHTQTRELTKLEIQSYNADCFILGEVPEHAPV